MECKSYTFDGAEFVPNNYVVILTKDGVHVDFQFLQYLSSVSEVGYALVNPEIVSRRQVLDFWRVATYFEGGENGTPNITYSHNGVEHVITLRTVCEALHIPLHTSYTVLLEIV